MWFHAHAAVSRPPPAAIEACLGHLLKRRAAGFLRSDKIAALFTKVGKVYDTAGEICRKVQEQLQQQADLTRLVPPLSSLSLCGQIRPLSLTWRATAASPRM